MAGRKQKSFASTLGDRLLGWSGAAPDKKHARSLRSRAESAPDFEDLRSLIPTHEGSGTSQLQHVVNINSVDASDSEASLADDSSSNERRRPSKRMEVAISIVFIILFGLALVLLCKQYLGLLMTWLMRVGGWQGPTLYSTLIMLTAFPMIWGYMILNVGAGFIYGTFYGVLITSLSCTAGSIMAFFTCKMFLKSCMGQVSKRFANFKQLVKVLEGKKGLRIMMMTRLTPVPIGIQNALFASANVSWERCFAATFFGLLPTQILNAYMGSTLRSMDDVMNGGSSGAALMLIQVGIAIFVTIYVNHRMKKEVTKACEQEYLASQMRRNARHRARQRIVETELAFQEAQEAPAALAGDVQNRSGDDWQEALELWKTAHATVNPFAEAEDGHFSSALLSNLPHSEDTPFTSPRTSAEAQEVEKHGSVETGATSTPISRRWTPESVSDSALPMSTILKSAPSLQPSTVEMADSSADEQTAI